LKKIIVFAACLLILSLSVTAKKRENKGIDVVYGEYSTCEADFLTKFWKEMFKGRGPGQTGNTLMALGDGFIFRKAKIDENGAVGPDALGGFTTTYIGGELILNSSGPWLNRGKLKATNIEATNYSIFDPNTGYLQFKIEFCGEFDNAPGTYFKVVAWYNGQPEMKGDRNGYPVFQRGFDFETRILINDEDVCGAVLDAECNIIE